MVRVTGCLRVIYWVRVTSGLRVIYWVGVTELFKGDLLWLELFIVVVI